MALNLGGKRYVPKYPSRSAMKVAVDVGGVLSDKSKPFVDGEQIYQSAMQGAYMWLHMLKHRTGRFPVIVSRVNHPNINHWVHRFVEALGVERHHVKLVEKRLQKRMFTREMTCVIDDEWDALSAMAQGAEKTLISAIWWQDVMVRPIVRSELDEWVAGKTNCLDSFDALQFEMRLECTREAMEVFNNAWFLLFRGLLCI